MPLDVPTPLRRDMFSRMQFLTANPDAAPAPTLPAAVRAAYERIPEAVRAVPEARRRELFSLTRDVIFINNGSFGSVPKCVQDVRRAWMDAVESEPVDALVEFGPYIRWALRELAEFVGAEPQNLVFVESATAGTNAVLKSLKLGPQDTVLTINLAYPAVTSTIGFLRNEYGVRIAEVNLPVPTSNDAIIKAFKEFFRTSCNTPTIAVFDHITSASGLVLPVKELVQICRENGVLSFIDGAHVVGQIDLNLRELDADFYVTNVHKWLFAPRGCAILHVRPNHHDRVHALTTSYSYLHGFQSEFLWQGTFDPTPFLTAPAGLAFWRAAVRSPARNHALAVLTGHFIAAATGGHLATSEPDTMLGMMATIILPLNASKIVRRIDAHEYRARIKHRMVMDADIPVDVDFPASAEGEDQQVLTPSILSVALHDQLRQQYGIEGFCTVVQGNVVVRISVQVYNTADDFVPYAHALAEILEVGDGKVPDALVAEFLKNAADIEAQFAENKDRAGAASAKLASIGGMLMAVWTSGTEWARGSSSSPKVM